MHVDSKHLASRSRICLKLKIDGTHGIPLFSILQKKTRYTYVFFCILHQPIKPDDARMLCLEKVRQLMSRGPPCSNHLQSICYQVFIRPPSQLCIQPPSSCLPSPLVSVGEVGVPPRQAGPPQHTCTCVFEFLYLCIFVGAPPRQAEPSEHTCLHAFAVGWEQICR